MAIFQYSLFILTLVDIILYVQGSGSLYDPPNRAVMWKYGYLTRKNYNYMQLNCGGEKQFEDGPYKCGVCGDPYNEKKEHEDGGKYGTKMISRYYPAGIKEMPVKVELLAFEQGFFEFRLCNADVNNVTQKCLDENILPIKEGYLAGTPLRFFPKGAGDFRLTVAVPPNLTCNRCVLQWRYHTANSWGTDPKTNEQGLGMGPQEEFRNCADIRIGGEIPNSVRDNPFFAPPDARTSSSIDKPTDQRKRLAFQNGTISVNPTSVDHLSLSARMLLHGGGGVNGAHDGSVSSGGSPVVSIWGDGTAKKEKLSSMKVPNLKNGRKTVSTNQIKSERRTERMNLMPIMTNSIGSVVKGQTIAQNDLNAKQQNGLFSLDNILHDTSKELQNGGLTASTGSVKLIGVSSKSGGQSQKEVGSKVTQVKVRGRHRGEQIMHGSDLELKAGSIKGKTSSNTGKQMQTSAKRIQSETGRQFIVDNSQSGTIDYMDAQRALLNDVMQITSGTLDAGRVGQKTNTVLLSSLAGQEKAAGTRIIGRNNIFDMTGGAVGPAPKPEKKASIIVQGAKISKTKSTADTVPMKAATRSGFSLSKDAAVNQNIQNDLDRSRSGIGVIDLTNIGRRTSNVITRQSGETQTAGAIDRVVTDLAIDGSRSNALTDNIDTGSRSFVQKLASKGVNQIPVRQNFGSNVNFGEQQTRTFDNNQASNIGGMVTRTKQRIATVPSSQNINSESPLTISALQPKSGRQRIFLVRASRPQGVMVSNSAKLSNKAMTISEGVQPGSSFVSMTASEVIDPLRTQTQRSDGIIVSEQDFLPNTQGTLISESKTQSPSRQVAVDSSGNVINDVEAFRNELIKSSLRQSGALIADKPKAKTEANALQDATPRIKSTKRQMESTNAAGTSLLASNEVGGKSESSLGQTVSELLNEAQKILSSTTTGISKVQTATTSNSKGSKSEVPVSDIAKGLQMEIKPASIATSLKISESSQTSNQSSVSKHSSGAGGTRNESPKGEIKQNSKDKTTLIESPPLQLSLEYLLGNRNNAKTEHSGNLVEGTIIERGHVMHVSDIKNGAVANKKAPSAIIETAQGSNRSPNVHETSIGTKPVQSKGSHSNVIDVNLERAQSSNSISENVKGSLSNTINSNTQQKENIQASHTDQHSVNNDINRHVSLLSNLDIIGPGTGIMLPIMGSNEATNRHQKNLNRQTADARTERPAGVIESRQIDSHLDSSNALHAKSTTNGGRLGGNILDFSSSINAKRQLTDNARPKDRQVAAIVNDLHSITTGQTRGGNGRSAEVNIAQPASQSSGKQSSTNKSVMGTAGSVKRINTISTSRNRVVGESISSEVGSHRLIDGNNRVENIDRNEPNPTRPIATRRQDSVNIERQINSFNLENLPGSSVIGTGVQMAGDGGMTAGFGPRDADIPSDVMLEDRRHMSRLDGQGRLDRGIATGSRAQSSEGSFLMARDPRTGLERRVQVGEHTRRRTDNVMTGDISHSQGDVHRSSSSPSNNPVYFLDMTRGSSPSSKRIDNMIINELPQRDGSRILSDMRLIEPVDRRIGSSRQTNIDNRMRTHDRRLESSTSDVVADPRRRTDGSRGGTLFDERPESLRSTTASDLRRHPEDTRDRSIGFTHVGLREGRPRDVSRVTTGFDRMAGSFDASTLRSGSLSGERIGPDILREGSRGLTEGDQRMGSFDVTMGGSGNTREADIGFTDAVSRAESNLHTDRSLGSGTAGQDSLFRGSRIESRRGSRLESRRGIAGGGRITGFDIDTRGPAMTTDIGTGFRERGSRLDSIRHREGGRGSAETMIRGSGAASRTGGGLRESSSRRSTGDRRGTDFDFRIGASGMLEGLSGGVREGSSRLDSRIRTGGEGRGTEFDVGIGTPDAIVGDSGKFRESSSRIDSRRRTGGDLRRAEVGTRMDGSELSLGASGGIRAGSSRLGSRGRIEGERRGSRIDARIRDSGVLGSDGLRRETSSGMLRAMRGERVSGTRDGTFASAGRGETGSRRSSRGMAIGRSGVPMISTDASGRMMMPGGFPSAMPSFPGPFPPHMGPESMIGGPGMSFDGGFPSIDPSFGPSLGAPGFLPGIGSSGMGPTGIGPGFIGPSGMGPSMGMPPPFSSMPFGPGVL